MSQREKFADERHGAESYHEECGVIAMWLHDGRLMFADEISSLHADLAEARKVVQHFLANRGGIVVSSDHEMALETEMMRRARAFIDRGA